jgi:hypothetical protein
MKNPMIFLGFGSVPFDATRKHFANHENAADVRSERSTSSPDASELGHDRLPNGPSCKLSKMARGSCSRESPSRGDAVLARRLALSAIHLASINRSFVGVST